MNSITVEWLRQVADRLALPGEEFNNWNEALAVLVSVAECAVDLAGNNG